METYYSTGQSPQRAVAPTEEVEETENEGEWKLMGRMIHIGDKWCAYKILVGYSEEKNLLKDSDVDGLLVKMVFAETENMC
jgi:hypothetical protein